LIISNFYNSLYRIFEPEEAQTYYDKESAQYSNFLLLPKRKTHCVSTVGQFNTNLIID